VHGQGVEDVWAVGEGGLVLTRGARGWSDVGSAFTRANLEAIGGVPARGVDSPAETWVVAESSVFRRDAAGWSRVLTTQYPQEAIAVSSARDVWVVGIGDTAHWDGRAWTRVANPTQERLRGVWSAGPGDTWAVGGAGTALHWDGRRWMAVPTGTRADLHGVWGASPRDVWAVGDNGTVLRWSGRRWAPVRAGVTWELEAVWGSGPNDVWIVGSTMAIGEAGGVVRWDGSTFHGEVRGPNGFRAVHGATGDDVWLVGGGGMVARCRGRPTACTLLRSGTDNSLRAVWASSGGEVLVGGAAGTLLAHQR
jgi:hypothetical protein